MSDPKKDFDWGMVGFLWIVVAPLVCVLWLCLAPAGCTDFVADRDRPGIGDGRQPPWGR